MDTKKIRRKAKASDNSIRGNRFESRIRFSSLAIAAIFAIAVFAAVTPMASAACNNGSVNVAFIPDPSGHGGGTLPTTNATFNKFSFTNVPYASVNAATLANYDTVVLITCDPMNDTNSSQRTDLINWVYSGGKLIIYDSECYSNGTVNYTWLPCKAISFCPGAWGATIVIRTRKYNFPLLESA